MADEIKREEELSVEEAFARMQELIKDMEREDVTLEQTFQDYEEGMRLVRVCKTKIDEVEQKVQLLGSDGTLTDAAITDIGVEAFEDEELPFH